MKDATEVIIRPLLTEKSTFLQRLNKFTFEVAKNATKIEIRSLVIGRACMPSPPPKKRVTGRDRAYKFKGEPLFMLPGSPGRG